MLVQLLINTVNINTVTLKIKNTHTQGSISLFGSFFAVVLTVEEIKNLVRSRKIFKSNIMIKPRLPENRD